MELPKSQMSEGADLSDHPNYHPKDAGLVHSYVKEVLPCTLAPNNCFFVGDTLDVVPDDK